MLRLLLDEHIPPQVARQLRRRQPALDVQALCTWQSGGYLGLSDEAVLRAAWAEQRTLVTYDVRTIPPLLKSWAEQAVDHGGVVLIDRRTIAPNDIGGLVSALAAVCDREAEAAWANRVLFLERH